MSTDPFLSVKVGDLMTKKVVNVDVTMTANEVAQLIVENKIESFPVTENGNLVGIVTGLGPPNQGGGQSAESRHGAGKGLHDQGPNHVCSRLYGSASNQAHDQTRHQAGARGPRRQGRRHLHVLRRNGVPRNGGTPGLPSLCARAGTAKGCRAGTCTH